jgi:hypothetical protein
MPSSERDWQHLRRVHAIALERYCARVLDEAATIVHDRDRTAHARYLARFRLVHERNAAMAAAFDVLRRRDHPSGGTACPSRDVHRPRSRPRCVA